METWLIFAILSAVTAGMHNFMMKVISERQYNASLVTTYAYAISSILFFICTVFSSKGFSIHITQIMPVILLSLASTIFYFFSILSRVESMRCIHTVIFYPIYKTGGPILATIIGLWYFGESLTVLESLGIMVGIMIPLLLITKVESNIQKNLRRGVVFAVITVILGALAVIPSKQVHLMDINVNLFLLFACLFGVITAYLSYVYAPKKYRKKKHNIKGVLCFSTLVGFTHFTSFYTFTHAAVGNFAIVYTINSFSILIPILLSVWYYNEHFTLKKAIVVILSVVSILLFI